MDDDVIGPGGTLALHRQLGSEIGVVFCAAGSTATEDRTRKAEARDAAAFMGFHDVAWLDFPDGQMSVHESRLASRLASLLRERQPEQVFCPYVSDHHRDHTAVAMALASAIRETGWAGEVWCYEVWSPLWPNVAVDISAVVDHKRRAIERYASQVASLHYADGIIGLNRYRGLRAYVDFAEAFFVVPADEYVAHAQAMNSF